MDKIVVSDIQFHAHTGVTEDERRVGQRYSVDIELLLDLSRAGKSDNLDDSVDYAAIVRTVAGIGTGYSFVLTEALAEALAREIQQKFPVKEVIVRARKLLPPVPEVKGYFGVEIHRKKE